jgi:hypothetical protein
MISILGQPPAFALNDSRAFSEAETPKSVPFTLGGFLRHHLPDEYAAEDLLQGVFVKAMRQGEGFCTLDNPRD